MTASSDRPLPRGGSAASEDRLAFQFGPYLLDARDRRLTRAGEPVALTPKAFDLLLLLVSRGGLLARRDELLAELWPDTIVEDGTLSRHFSTLRRALGADAGRLLETVPRAGYRFRGEVERVDPSVAAVARADGRDLTAEAGGWNLALPKWLRWVLLAAIPLAAGAWILARSSDPAPAAGPAPTRPLAVAVLPFLPIEPEDPDLYARVGLADTLIARLSRLPGLIVRPINAVRDFADTERDPLAIGRRLGVDSVLDGTLRRTNEEVRVTARLLRVEDGLALWADTFAVPGRELASVEETIARRTVTALAPALSPLEAEALTLRAVDPEAHDRYLRGRYFLGKRTVDGQRKAAELFREAIAIDPGSGELEAGLAMALVLLANYSDPASLAIEARLHATRALELEPRSADAHAVLGLVAMNHDRDWAGAELEFRSALALEPNHVNANHWYGEMLALLGRGEAGLALLDRAMALDPLSLPVGSDRAKALYFSRRYSEAVAAAEAVLELDSRFSWAHAWRGLAHLELGDCPGALADLEVFSQLDGTPLALGWLGYVTGRCGNPERAAQIAGDLERRSASEFVLVAPLAAARLGAGDPAGALESLEEAASRGEIVLGWSTAPVLDPLRGDPRFHRLLQEVHLE